MNAYKRILFAWALFAVVTSRAQALEKSEPQAGAQSMSLKEAINYALQHNPELKKSQFDVSI